ncbi:Ig-like domain-containing protein [Cellulomonas sp. DKR-3]|uniref:Ig-like domain-containing protein n=1 Tax=Cellulomonas fulva TaxID=2835530 RepID=A0ABS5TYF7_9CELL|nr:Ig-like domain-containing protein [Cellulomonas fulva]MBT0994180.1 Ig-like domain-containing protein [Cellulomonas fulva]
MATCLVVPSAANAVPGDEVPQASLGYPAFTGSATPVPDTGVAYTPGGYLAKVFAADQAAGAGSAPGDDFWLDRMLARTGPMFDGTENAVAFTRGRTAFMKTHSPTGLGWRGDTAYIDTTGKGDAFAYTVKVDGVATTMQEQSAQRRQTPSYFRSVFTGGGITLTQTKFITDQNVMVADVTVTSAAAHTVTLTATSPHATRAEGDELVGTVSAYNDLTTIFPRLSGDGFTADGTSLVTTLDVAAGGTAATKLQLGMITDENPASATEYQQYREATPGEAYTTHVTAYNQWWVDNVPYLDTPEDNIDKTLFYRWWLMRYNFLDADIPGNDYQFPTSMEGVLGYNNAIVLTVGMFIDDLKYFRDPAYSYGPAVSVGETSKGGKFVDNPGDPANWSNSYTQYITEAAWRAYELHGGPGAIGETLGRHSQDDVEGLLEAYDGNDNGLIEYSWGAMTGNDADAVSFHWRPNAANMDRTESAYLYSNALAAANFYREAGDTEGAATMDALAQRVKDAVLEYLWEPARETPDQVGLYGNLLKHRMTADGALNPWKEINNYYPFSVGLMPKPGDADYDQPYVEALRLFADADQYPVFPFYTANQVDQADYGGPGSNNFSVINSTVWFRMLSSVLRDYPQDYVTPEMYKQLLYWNAWAHYQNGDNRLPNQNEFWSNGSAEDGGSIGYRSWIHHTILGATNFTVIEDSMGLRSRSDAKIELDPIDIDWPYFTADNIRYHDRDLAVVWDEDGTHYGDDVPAGYSVYLDGELAFTVSDLAHVLYDPATGDVQVLEGDATVVTANDEALATSSDIRYADDDRVVDLFAKAGTDITTATTGAADLARGADVTATYSASGRAASGAVDGSTANEPFWGTAGSPNATDQLVVDLGEEQAVDEVRLYFYKSSTTATVQGYALPQVYGLEYDDGGEWVPVDDQARTPAYVTANGNVVRFPSVTTSKVRLTVKHAAGARTGLKEIQVRSTGEEAPASTNVAPQVKAYLDTTFSQPSQARVIGTVSDDGLPSIDLTSRWSVVDAPEGGEAIFASPSSATTVVQFTAEGRYVLRLTVDDGELTTTKDVTVDATLGDTAKVNVALDATASASRVTGWNSVAAINDGNAPYPVSAESDAWGTWGTAATNNAYTATLTWDDPVRVDESRILFHSNGASDGVLPPASWKLEYLDGTTWRDVPNPSTYGTTAGVFNAVTHDPVTTTAIRATLVRRGASYPGIIEWQALAEAPTSVEDVAVRTTPGTAPELPEQVEIVYADGTRAQAPVSWQAVDPAQYAGEGSFTVLGFVDGTSQLARATVWVREVTAVQINTFDAVDVSTRRNVAPSLPARVVAVYNDGGQASLPVTWDAVDPADYATVGTFEVEGTVEGTDKRPVATVTVLATADQAPVVTIATDPAMPASTWFDGPVEVTVTATDDETADPAIEVQTGGDWTPYDGPVTVDAEGSTTVRARATDDDGLVSSVQTLVVNIDTVAPVVAAAFEPEARRLTLTATEGGSGLASVEYRVGEGAWRTYTGAVTLTDAATVTYRATDKAGNVSDEATTEVPEREPGQSVNVAPNATASVSGTTSWNRAAGVNDGVDTVPVTSQASAWGTFGITGATQWAQLTWDEPVTVDTSKVLFFDDGGGMEIPASWTLQYLDGEDWVDVPNPSGFTTTENEYDVVTHDPVTTTALRATLTKGASGYVGIVEWQVLDVAPSGVEVDVPTGPVLAGTGFPVTLVGGTPDTDYTVTLEPGGTALGTLTTDASGNGVLHTAALPERLEGGDYTVRLTAGSEVHEAALVVEAADLPPLPELVEAGTVTVTGTATVGSTLTATPAGWGPEGVEYAYQWFADGSIVAGATSATLPLKGAQAGATIVARVTGFADGMVSASVESAPVGPVAAGALKTGKVTVKGTAKVGVKLTATTSGWVKGTSLAYRWKVNGAVVPGATKAAFTPRPVDRGKKVVAQVRGSLPGYTTTAWVSSAATAKVATGTFRAPRPSITGTAKAGAVLKVKVGSWTPAPTTLRYRWSVNGTPVSWATKPSYTVRAADKGKKITVTVTGSRTGYTTRSATSSPVTVAR